MTDIIASAQLARAEVDYRFGVRHAGRARRGSSLEVTRRVLARVNRQERDLDFTR